MRRQDDPLSGAKACMSIISGSASLVNRVFTAFLSQLPRTRSDLRRPAIPALERTRLALQTLAELVGDPSIAHRNPRSLLSFSCVTPEVAKSQQESLKFYAKDIDKTYCPLGRDGRPIRRCDTSVEVNDILLTSLQVLRTEASATLVPWRLSGNKSHR